MRAPSAPLRRFLLGAAACLAGCAGGLSALPPDHAVPARADWLEASARLARRVSRLAVGEAGGRPFAMEVEAVGRGDERLVWVLVHGVLSDRRTWRFATPLFAASGGVWLVDLPGAGRSDAPDPSAWGPDAYSPSALAACLGRALRGLQRARRAPASLVLVGHSLGGVVVRRLMTDPALRAEFAEVRGRVAGIALLSTPDDRIERPDPSLVRLATASDLELAAGLVAGVVRRSFVAAVSEGADPRDPPSREEVLRMESELACAARRRAQQAMLRRVAPLRPDGSPDEEASALRCAQQASLGVPCLLLHGDRDGMVPAADAGRCAARVPGARAVTLRGAHHALPTERPVEVVREVEAWARLCGLLPSGG